jgi:hypothetical protein
VGLPVFAIAFGFVNFVDSGYFPAVFAVVLVVGFAAAVNDGFAGVV